MRFSRAKTMSQQRRFPAKKQKHRTFQQDQIHFKLTGLEIGIGEKTLSRLLYASISIVALYAGSGIDLASILKHLS